MANDLVVTLGARLDQFASDMDQAGNIADSTVSRIEQSFANLNPGINLSSLSTLAVGAVAGFSALLAYVASLNKGLDDMAKQSERVGLSLERFQQLKFGAAALGVGAGAFGTDMEAFTTNAQKALTTTNDLKRVMEANGVAIADANGKLKTTDDLFQHAVDIIKRAPTIADALQMGQFLGLSKEFAQGIYDAGDNFLRLAASANSVGAVIDDATIKKAQQFTTEWNKASAIWAAQMKASALEFLPLINDAIASARTLMQYVATVTQALGAIKDFAFVPDVDTASLSKLQSLEGQISAIYDKMAAGQQLNPIELFRVANIAENGEVTLAMVDKYLGILRDRIINFNNDPSARIRVTPDQASINPGVKKRDEANDAYDTQVNAINKQIALMQAQAATVRDTAGAQEEYRVQLLLSEKAAEAGRDMTLELNDAIAAQSKRAADAKQNLAEQQFQLQKMNAASQTVGSALSSSFTDAIVDGKKLNEVFGDLIKTLEKAALNSLIMSFFTPGAGQSTSLFSSLLPKFAGGTDSAPGGMAVVGEQGPELVNLPRGSQVIPNAAIAGAGGSIVYSPAIDARGASVDAVARLAQILAEDRATFASRTVATIQQARRGRTPGL